MCTLASRIAGFGNRSVTPWATLGVAPGDPPQHATQYLPTRDLPSWVPVRKAFAVVAEAIQILGGVRELQLVERRHAP